MKYQLVSTAYEFHPNGIVFFTLQYLFINNFIKVSIVIEFDIKENVTIKNFR